uniref:Uncharacterized protein n=1 Tax=Rhizophora mucronata TaxID=61149 RepID=A0A2P2ISC4_RHIMU
MASPITTPHKHISSWIVWLRRRRRSRPPASSRTGSCLALRQLLEISS